MEAFVYCWTDFGTANAKCWKVTSPLGKSEDIKNLSAYCSINNINIGHMSSRGKTKGYLCERLVM